MLICRAILCGSYDVSLKVLYVKVKCQIYLTNLCGSYDVFFIVLCLTRSFFHFAGRPQIIGSEKCSNRFFLWAAFADKHFMSYGKCHKMSQNAITLNLRLLSPMTLAIFVCQIMCTDDIDLPCQFSSRNSPKIAFYPTAEKTLGRNLEVEKQVI